jgi:hypothetical protein
MSNQMFHVKLENPVRYPWRERNVVYLVLLSYSLWARRIFWEYVSLITHKNHEGDKSCG